MPLDGFAEWITPIERFFVRTHVYVPKVDLASWRLLVEGEVRQRLTLTLEDLRALPRVDLVGLLECAGNGRGLYEPSVPGLQWTYGAVGNARWAGVRLADLLRKAGVNESARHVLFDGADVPIGAMPDFQRSIPIEKALAPETMLAFEMNGETLPASHGFPLRLAVPGWAGDSWTKWVTRIRVLNGDAESFWMKSAYRHPGKAVPPGTAIDPAAMRPVTALRVKSVIASPLDGAELGSTPLRVTGAAWGSEPISSVEFSADRGRTWQPARLGRDQSRYAWRLWEAAWTPPAAGYYVLMARARDASGDTQPFVQEWNPSGYLWNVVPQVAVTVGEKAGAALGSAPPRAAAEMPPSLRSSCLGCHEADVMEQQRLTRAQWDREITKMMNWGAPVKPDARNEILDYLSSRFGPRQRR